MGDDPVNSAERWRDLSVEMASALDRLPECLADSRARRSLMSVARMLPQAFTTGPIGLEIRLSGSTAVDFFAAATPGDPAFDALITSLESDHSGVGWGEPKRALDLAAALDRWRRRDGSLPGIARYLLVEVDSPDEPDGCPALPSIFLAPRGNRDFPRPSQPPNAFHRFVEATTMAAAELSGVWPHPATAEALAKVVEALPDEGDIFAVGAMTGRKGGASMRIAIRRLNPEGIHAVLQAAGRRRQGDLLAEWALTTPAPQRNIAFEIGPGAEARVGLELSPMHDWKQAMTDGWPEILDDLVSRGVVDADRAAVVTPLIDPLGNPLRGVAHVKVAADESGILPNAKLYVGLLYRNGQGDGKGKADEMA